MRQETVARNYASTLLALADRNEGSGAYGPAISLVATLLSGNQDLRLFLETPRIEATAKKDALRRAFEGKVPAPFLNFLQVVVDKRRQGLLEGIAREYMALVDERLGRIHAEVTVARPLDPESRNRVEAALGQVLGGTVVAHERVSPRILGGVIVNSGDRVWDGSLLRRLEGMRRSLLHVQLPEGAAGAAGTTPAS